MKWSKKHSPIEITSPRRVPREDAETGFWSDRRLILWKLILPPLAWFGLLFRTFPIRRVAHEARIKSPWTSFRLILPLVVILVLSSFSEVTDEASRKINNATDWLEASAIAVQLNSIEVDSSSAVVKSFRWVRVKTQPPIAAGISFCIRGSSVWSPWLLLYLWVGAVTLLLTGLQRLGLQGGFVSQQKLRTVISGSSLKELQRAWMWYRFRQMLLLAAAALAHGSLLLLLLDDFVRQYWSALPEGWPILWSVCSVLNVGLLFVGRYVNKSTEMPTQIPKAETLPEIPIYCELPQISYQGKQLPQLIAKNQHQLHTIDLEKIRLRNASKLFTNAVLSGLTEELYHHPGLALACRSNSSTCVLNKLHFDSDGLSGEQARDKSKEELATEAAARAEEESENITRKEIQPLEKTLEDIFRVIYLTASTDGIIRPSHNHVIRAFANQYPLCLLLDQKSLASILVKLSEEKWQLQSVGRTVATMWGIRGALAKLGTVRDYMDALKNADQFILPRAPDGIFDPMHSRSFVSLNIGFEILIDRLIQAIVFADRRVGKNEHKLLDKLAKEAKRSVELAEE